MLTSVFGCGMIFVLGRFRGERSFFVPGPKEMTLGDSVNNRQGSFLFSFGI
jgi:hypothetical protein